MLTREEFVEINVLRRQGKSIKAISRELNVSRNTVRKYLRSESPPSASTRSKKPTKLDGYRDYLRSRIDSAKPDWIPATVLFREIQQLGYTGGETTLRNYLRTLKPQAKPDPVVRFETPPGQQMQVDWGSFRLNKQRISLFVATLGWSRACYGEFVSSERVEVLRGCHEHAFECFGGVPHEILYDNMRTVVSKRNAYGEGLHRFNPALMDLAKHYGFLPRLCKPYRARTKGKVERQIGYIRRSFYVPLVSRYRQLGLTLDMATLNYEFMQWLLLQANARCHGTTGEIPAERLQVEQSALLTLPPTGLCGESRISVDRCRPHCVQVQTELQHRLSVYDAVLESL